MTGLTLIAGGDAFSFSAVLNECEVHVPKLKLDIERRKIGKVMLASWVFVFSVQNRLLLRRRLLLFQ